MEQNNYVYEEDDYEEGLTFKKIGHFLKVGWLRMVIYAAILLVIAAIIALPIKVWYRSEPVAQTSVEYVYKGIENGVDPNGGTFDKDAIIATSVLSKAVSRTEFTETIKDISALRAAMRVEAVPTDEYVKLTQAAADGDEKAVEQLRNYKMYPTRFNVVLSNPGSLGISDEKAVDFLNAVVTEYYGDFKKNYAVTNMFDVTVYDKSENATLEYTNVYDRYAQTLEPIKTYLQQLQEEDPSFVSVVNNTTFAQLLSELTMLNDNDYTGFNSYILANNVWRDPQTALKELTESKRDLEDQKKNMEEYKARLETQIAGIKPNTITTNIGDNVTTTTAYPSEYYEYQRNLDGANRDLMSFDNRLANINRRIATLEGNINNETSAEVSATALARLKSIEAESVKFVTKVNDVINDYYNTQIIPSAVRQPLTPIVTRRGSDLNVLMVLAIAVVIGLLAGGIVTGIKISRYNAKKAKEEAVPDAPAAPEKKA